MIETRINMPDDKVLIIRDVNPLLSELAILSKGRIVKIGTLDKAKKELRVFRNRAIHEHHRTRSYGFNAFIIKNSKIIKNIRIHEEDNGEYHEYLLSRDILLAFGNEMNFIGESQIFYPIRDLEIISRL